MGLGDHVSHARLETYPLIALVIFFVVFVGIVLYVVLRRRGAWDRERRLPLDDGRRTDGSGERER